jgi:hypothetical protein
VTVCSWKAATAYPETVPSTIVHVAQEFIFAFASIGRNVMHAVVRNYSGKGAKELIDLIEKNKPEVERLIRGVKGL